jgi:tetratricopeptide (TPR) repeat protein
LGGDGEIAVDMAQKLSSRWVFIGRYHAARNICEETLSFWKDNKLTYNLSKIYHELGDITKALDYCKKSIEIFRSIGHSQPEAASLRQLSIIYQQLGDYSQALKLAQDSLNIFIAIGDRQGEANSLDQLSIIYQKRGDLNQSLKFSQDSLKIKIELDDFQGVSVSLHQLSIIYKRLGNYPKSLKFSQDSLKIAREIGNLHGEGASLHQLSIIHESLGDYPQALKFSQDSLNIKREIGDCHGEAATLAKMANIAHKQGNLQQAHQLYLKAANILGSTCCDYNGLIITLLNLGNNDEPEALGYLSQSLWLTHHCSTNLKDGINLISIIYQKVQSDNTLTALLGSIACHLCHTRSHPELEQLVELSDKMIIHAASQQGIETQADYDNWKSTNRLDDPDYFLPELLTRLESIVGDGWLFDREAFPKENQSGTSD